MGRLLIAALLEHWGLLPEPLMYMSGYLSSTRRNITTAFIQCPQGDWEGWVAFFLEGVALAAQEAERNIVAGLAALLAPTAASACWRRPGRNGSLPYRLLELLPMIRASPSSRCARSWTPVFRRPARR